MAHLTNCMGNDQQDSSTHATNGLPSLFTILDPLFGGHIERIEEHPAGLLEAHTVVSLVGDVLGIVPLESDARHPGSVITVL